MHAESMKATKSCQSLCMKCLLLLCTLYNECLVELFSNFSMAVSFLLLGSLFKEFKGCLWPLFVCIFTVPCPRKSPTFQLEDDPLYLLSQRHPRCRGNKPSGQPGGVNWETNFWLWLCQHNHNTTWSVVHPATDEVVMPEVFVLKGSSFSPLSPNACP